MGSNASGGDVSVSSLYDLREVLDRIGAAVELSPQHDGTINHANVRGTASLFEFDSQDNLAISKYF